MIDNCNVGRCRGAFSVTPFDPDTHGYLRKKHNQQLIVFFSKYYDGVLNILYIDFICKWCRKMLKNVWLRKEKSNALAKEKDYKTTKHATFQAKLQHFREVFSIRAFNQGFKHAKNNKVW